MRQILKSKFSQLVNSCEQWPAITLTVVFVVAMTSVFGQMKHKNDWADMNLTGNVKTLKETVFDVKQEILETFGTIQPSVKITSLTYIFNSDGNITEYNHYNQNGGLRYKNIYKYDSLGRAVENSSFDKKEILIKKATFNYDSTGNLAEENFYNPDGSLKEKSINFYDAIGNIIEENRYNSDGKLISKLTLKYDGYGNIVEGHSFTKKGKELYKFTNIYDSNNHLIEKAVFMPNGGMVSKIVYLYTFDNKGNWIERITFNMDITTKAGNKNDIPTDITKRVIEYL